MRTHRTVRGCRMVTAIAMGCVAGSFALPRTGALEHGVPAAAMLAGCFRDDCSPTGSSVEANEGRMVDANTWESAPVDGIWKEFSGADYIYFRGDFGGRQPYAWDVYVSVSANPVRDLNSYTQASGNIALVNGWGPNQIAVSNGTCSQYYVRVVLYAPPFPPPAPAADAGNVDGATNDGGDAAADASASAATES